MPRINRNGHNLTLMQDQFAHWYAITGNAGVSARRAGYSESVAKVDVYRYLEQPRFQAAIEFHKEQLQITSAEEQMDDSAIIRALSYEARAGETSASRVAALRTLADINGLTHGTRGDLPAELKSLLEGVKAGFNLAKSQDTEQDAEPPVDESVVLEARLVD